MLLEFITAGVKVAITDIADLPAGTAIGQMGLLTNHGEEAEELENGDTLALRGATVPLETGDSLPLIYDGSRWREFVQPRKSLLQSAGVADVQPANELSVALVEGDLVITATDGDAAASTFTLSPDA